MSFLLLAVITASVFWQVSGHEFLAYDDINYITGNPHVKSGLTRDSFIWAFTTSYFSYWHPLTWLSHMLDVELFGMDAGGHHLMNVFFHTVNALLLLLLLSRMTGSPKRSFFVAALFALHPLHVESVAWIAERKDVLSAFFWLLTMLLYARYVERPSTARYLLTLCAFISGLMSKPMVMTLPAVLFIMDYWPLGRLTIGTAGSNGPEGTDMSGRKTVYKRLILEKVPFMALSAASGIITFYAQQKNQALSSIDALPLLPRVMNAVSAYGGYIMKMIWPVDLAVIYPLSGPLPAVRVIWPAVAIIGISVLAISAARRHPYILAGWLWYLVTLAPVSGLVQVGGQSMADRYTYIPIIGLFIMTAWGAPLIIKRYRFGSLIMHVLSAVIIALCAAVTWVQLDHWKNNVTLFSHASKVVEGNFEAHNYLGYALAAKGSLEEARLHYSEALRIKPDNEMALFGLNNSLIGQGKSGEAVSYLSRALRRNPGSANVNFNMGYALMKQGRLDKAVNYYLAALRLGSGPADVYINLGDTLTARGKLRDAVRYYTEGLRRHPDNDQLYFGIGLATAMQGRLDESISYFQNALRINPEMAEAHYNLGAALARKGKFDEAVMHFKEVLRIDPGFEEARRGMEAAMKHRGP